MANAALYLGNPRINAAGFRCCGKPVGCDMTHEGCAYLRHPWKRAMVYDDRTVRCQCKCLWDEGWMQCGLSHGHDGPCEMAVTSNG